MTTLKAAILLGLLLSVVPIARACDITEIVTWEVTPACEVKVLSITDEAGRELPYDMWVNSEQNWKDHLQQPTTSKFDRERGVPPTARRID